MAFVYFKCDCAKSLAVDAADVGRKVQCPDCGKSLPVPAPELYWKCACGEEMSAPKDLSGELVRCAACQAEHTVPVRLALKHDRQPQRQPAESQFDVPRVPVTRTNEVQCPKCGYMSPPVLERCPQCQSYLHKGAIIRRQCIAVAKVLLIIGLGWFLTANFTRISGYVKSLLGIETTPQVEAPASSGNVVKATAPGVPAGK